MTEAIASTTNITGSAHKQAPKKPDDAALKKSLAEINSAIDKLKKQNEAVREKINKLPGGSKNNNREELYERLNKVRDQQKDLKESKKAVLTQLDAIQQSMKKKTAAMKAGQAKSPYKTSADIDRQISSLEKKIESGVKLVEEKQILSEISGLKRHRNTLDSFKDQQAELDKERKIHDDLKKNIDDSQMRNLSQEYDTIKAEIANLQESQKSNRDKRNQLYEEQNNIKSQLDQQYEKMRTLRDEHRQGMDEYYAHQRQIRDLRKEQAKQRQKEYEDAQRKVQAEQERELAEIPAFSQEISTCDTLINYLQSYGSDNTATTDGVNGKANAEPKAAASGVRQADTTANVPEGAVLVKKDDREENFFVGGKKKGGNKAPKEKKGDQNVKFPLAIMESFWEVKVDVPTKPSEFESTIETLKHRKENYLKDQPKKTEENKKKAEEKIASLLAKEEETKAEDAKAEETKA
ncbi:multicopy suppressor of BFA (Brefeldin A) [Umbelopsis sp. WA50703]